MAKIVVVKSLVGKRRAPLSPLASLTLHYNALWPLIDAQILCSVTGGIRIQLQLLCNKRNILQRLLDDDFSGIIVQWLIN